MVKDVMIAVESFEPAAASRHALARAKDLDEIENQILEYVISAPRMPIGFSITTCRNLGPSV